MLLFRDFFDKKINIFGCSLLLSLLVVAPGTTEDLKSILSSSEPQKLENLGAFYWQRGDLYQAITAWKKEAEIYQIQGLPDKQASALLKISECYTNLGQSPIAIFTLKKVLSLTENPALLAQTWMQLGNAHSRSGEFSEALAAYNKSLEIEKSLLALNNLVILLQKQIFHAQLQANSSRKGEETEKYLAEVEFYRAFALKYAAEAKDFSKTAESSSSVRALIEWNKVSSTGLSAEELERGRRILDGLPGSRNKVFLAINWARLDPERTNYWLSQGTQVAKTIGDGRAESFALLELGLEAEKSGNFPQALELAQAAQLKAQSEFAFDSLYRAQWLAGRIYRQMGNQASGIIAYREAIASLDVYNQGLTTINFEQRLDFRTKIEAIYREMLDLLLNSANLSNFDLNEAIFVFDKLRLAQLQNYFGDNCFNIEGQVFEIQDTLTSKNAVLLNSIILEDETHLLLQLPDGTLRHSKTELGKAEITKLAIEWYKNLNEPNNRRFKLQSLNFYEILLRPFESELEEINPETIVFVHDGILRNLPMAALYDGEKFLAQKWPSVSSLGLNFKGDTEPASSAVAFGLGVARGNWSELPYASEEIEEVVELVGGEKFLNDEFTAQNFAQELSQEEYSIVHLATHGYFGGTAENSFILAYDRPLSALELEDFLSQSKANITLLVMSACETALSSDRSVLGLAGVALRSGVDTVLGSFWPVQDDSQLELIKAFYSNIEESNLDKAEALQKIQIEQIEQKAHPSSWAALNLIGDW